MKYRDLRDFIGHLRAAGELREIGELVSPKLEMTALSDLVLRQAGPALLFSQPSGSRVPVLTNLFGTPRRVGLGMGVDDLSGLRQVGALLASLREPEPPRGLSDAGRLVEMAAALWNMKPAKRSDGPCREERIEAADVDLGHWPIQTC